MLPSHFDAARDLDGLQPPVQRFFRAALADGAPLVAALDLEHGGTFNLAAEGPDPWITFTSTRRVITRRPDFVWDARMATAPGLTVRVHDAYVAVDGILHPTVLRLFSLTGLRGVSPEPGGVAHGEFMRFVADGAVVVSLRLRFEPGSGLIESVRAGARGRTVGKGVVMTPWHGCWCTHAEHGGMKPPMSDEVAWSTPDGRRTYWCATVTALACDVAC